MSAMKHWVGIDLGSSSIKSTLFNTEGRALGDTTTLADTSVVDSIRAGAGSAEED